MENKLKNYIREKYDREIYKILNKKYQANLKHYSSAIFYIYGDMRAKKNT